MPDLPPPCRWLDCPDGSFLRCNYTGIASVKPRGGQWAMELTWQGRVRRSVDATLAGAKDRIERFVAAQAGLPGKVRR